MSYLICYDAEDTTTQVSPDSAFTGGTCTASAQAAESTTSAWLDSGFCLLDADTRILASDYSLSDVQTVELCTSTCTSLQYTYAGMESESFKGKRKKSRADLRRVFFSSQTPNSEPPSLSSSF